MRRLTDHTGTLREWATCPYEIADGILSPIAGTTFEREDIRERDDLQQLIKGHIGALTDDSRDADALMVLSEEFGDWEDSHRRIDLLCLDSKADLVVVELKRTQDGGHMELQALRYAAMVSAMTFEQAVRAHAAHLRAEGSAEDARESILSFLGWAEPDDEAFAQNVRIVLASAEFSRELTTAVMWLNEREVDIRCVRIRPYRLDDRILVDIQQIIPLRESSEYQVRIREKARSERASKKSKRKWDRVSFMRELGDNHGAETVLLAEDILEWVEPLVDRIWWGEGSQLGSFYPKLDGQESWWAGFSLWSSDGVEVLFQYNSTRGPFADDALRREWRDRLTTIPGVTLPDDRLTGRPSFELSLLKHPEALATFKDVYGWVIRTLRDFDQGLAAG